MTILEEYLDRLTPAQRRQLVRLSGISSSYLNQIANCSRPGFSAKKAADIHYATVVLNRKTEGQLPVLELEALAQMCEIQKLA